MYIVMFCAGVLISLLIFALVLKKRSVGTLRVDRSDPDDGPYMFLELSKGVGDISNKKYVVLKVDTKNYISQK